MREVCEEPDSVETIVSLLGQSLPANHEKYANSMESGLTRRAGRYREIIVIKALKFPHCWGCGDFRRVSGPGMGPYLPRVRRNCPPSVGEPISSSYSDSLSGGRPLCSSNQSAILADGTGVSTPWGPVSTRENSVFFPRLSNFWIHGMTPGPGMGPFRLRVELAQ